MDSKDLLESQLDSNDVHDSHINYLDFNYSPLDSAYNDSEMDSLDFNYSQIDY